MHHFLLFISVEDLFLLLLNLWPESTVGNLPMNSRLLDYFAILQWWVSGFLCKVVCSAQPLANVHVLRRPSPSLCLTCHMFYITEFLEKRVELATLKSIACMCSGHTLTHIVHSNLKYISLSLCGRKSDSLKHHIKLTYSACRFIIGLNFNQYK